MWHRWSRIWNKRRISNREGTAALQCPSMIKGRLGVYSGHWLTGANWNHLLDSVPHGKLTIPWSVFHTGKPYLGQCFTRESHILVSVSHGKAISWSVFHTEKPYLGQCFTREGRLLLPTTALGPSTIRTIDWAKNILIWLFNYKTYEDHLNNSFTKFKTWI